MPPSRQKKTGSPSRGNRGPVRDEQKRLTRERLIDAAAFIFEAHGYGAASIGDIAVEAEVNRTTFYLHFADKAECFFAVVEEKFFSFTVDYWRSLDKALVARNRTAIRAWLEEDALNWWEERRALLPALEEARIVDEQFAKRWAANVQKFSGELQEYMSSFKTESEKANARVEVELLVTTVGTLYFRCFVHNFFNIGKERALDLFTDMWCGAQGFGTSSSAK